MFVCADATEALSIYDGFTEVEALLQYIEHEDDGVVHRHATPATVEQTFHRLTQ